MFWMILLLFATACGAQRSSEVNKSQSWDAELSDYDDEEDIVAERPVAISGSFLSLCESSSDEDGLNQYTCTISDEFDEDLSTADKDYALVIDGKRVPIKIVKSADGTRSIYFELEEAIEIAPEAVNVYDYNEVEDLEPYDQGIHSNGGDDRKDLHGKPQSKGSKEEKQESEEQEQESEEQEAEEEEEQESEEQEQESEEQESEEEEEEEEEEEQEAEEEEEEEEEEED